MRGEPPAAADQRAEGEVGGIEEEPREPGGAARDRETDRPLARAEAMRRYYGGADVYGRRRLLASIVVVAVIVILIALVGGC